jgi:hypothetical protein
VRAVWRRLMDSADEHGLCKSRPTKEREREREKKKIKKSAVNRSDL